MNDRQLKYMITLAEEGNMTNAAGKLYISQPSLSNMLASVENELGEKLFERKTTRMVLTPAGRCYIDAAREILRIQRDLERKISEVQEYPRGYLTIGCGSILSTFLFPLIIPAFKRKYPGLTIQLVENSMTEMHDMLYAGELDVLFSYERLKSDYLGHISFYEEEALLFAPPGYTARSTKTEEGHRYPVIRFQELEGQPFVLFKTGNRLRIMVDRIFEDFGFTPNVVLETDNWQTCISMAAAGEAFTLLTSHSIMESALQYPVKRYSIDGQYFRRLYLNYHKTLSPRILDDFVSLVQDRVGGEPR